METNFPHECKLHSVICYSSLLEIHYKKKILNFQVVNFFWECQLIFLSFFFFYRVRFESLKELSSITNLMFCMNLRFDESFEHTFFVNRYVYETANLKFFAYARCTSQYFIVVIAKMHLYF